MPRDTRVPFKISEEKKKELQNYADSYGVTMSGLVAVIVGQWLHQQNKVINPMVQEMTNILKTQLGDSYENLTLEEIQKVKKVLDSSS